MAKNRETQEEFLPHGHQAPELKVSLLKTSSDLLQITNHTLIITLYLITTLITVSVICSFAHLHTCTQHVLYSVSWKSYLIFIFILFFVIGCFMSTMYNLLHIPLCTVMLILIFNSTAYCHAHSFTFYILFFISYSSFILSYVYFPCVVFSIFALSMERTRLSFHCWLYSLCIVVYVTNKT